MAAKMKLGKLSDLASMELDRSAPGENQFQIDIDKIDVYEQVRKSFNNIEELAGQILSQNGIHTPLIVHADANGRYRLITGERRLKAAQHLNMKQVPVIVKRNMTDFEIEMLQISENVDRENLSLWEECLSIIYLVDKYGTEAAKQAWAYKEKGKEAVNKSDSWISKRNSFRHFDQKVKDLLISGATEDLELLSALNAILKVSEREFNELSIRLNDKSGDSLPVTRNEVRAIVARYKEKPKQVKPVESKKEALQPTNSVPETNAQDETTIDTPHATPEVSNVASESNVTHGQDIPKTNKSDKTDAVITQDHAKLDTLNKQLIAKRLDIHDLGKNVELNLTNLQATLSELGKSPVDKDFILWTAFVDILSPLIGALDDRTQEVYIQRYMSKLKSKNARDIFDEIHMVADGGPNEPSFKSTPPKPENW